MGRTIDKQVSSKADGIVENDVQLRNLARPHDATTGMGLCDSVTPMAEARFVGKARLPRSGAVDADGVGACWSREEE
jgi:hypothetical protein